MANGLIFKKFHLPMVLGGTKTATRRIHKRPIKAGKTVWAKKNYYKFYDFKLKILKSYDERLGDMTLEDAKKEGGYTLDEFKEVWIEINGEWDPDLIVRVYEFEVIK